MYAFMHVLAHFACVDRTVTYEAVSRGGVND
jgi:hypothetical protein